MKMLMKILNIFGLLASFANAQVDRDWSFQRMCEFWDGGSSYRPRSNGFNSIEGDKCTFEFPVATDSRESAKRYCQEHVPYHIIDGTPGERTKCSAEATLICKNEWVQLFGRCYKMTKELMTRDVAVGHCKKQKDDATIAFLHRETLPFRIYNYFTRVSRLWIDASETITKDLIDENVNGNLLLAIDGYMYNLPNIALTRVDSSETAMVLCEYTPPMNRAESNHLLKKYGEIYYPTVSTSEGAFIRTTSSLNRIDEDLFKDNRYCSRVMNPFIHNSNARSAIPTREFLEEVNKVQNGLIIRTAAFSKSSRKSERIGATCSVNKGSIYHVLWMGSDGNAVSQPIDKSLWRSNEPNEICDAGSWSSALVSGRDGSPGLEAMSDARYAPIYCQNIVDSYSYGDCPAGFTEYYRKSLGQKWCHRFFPDKMVNEDAEAHCQKHGAHLTGYTNQEELKLLADLIGDNYEKLYHNLDTWIGARRRSECITTGTDNEPGYDRDPASKCSRVRVFEWQNGVAPNPPDIVSDWNHDGEPNFAENREQCLAVMKGNKLTGTLNDVPCTMKYNFICGTEAPIIIKSP
ncbi:hypothetical protein GCK72_002780 [Caenorhabditis remanei]|uniref:C-type lectin domain-containing protein n=1 Tax=Caenorhabditis remanei TaxID=31234 RepID=A0A6A5HVV6_CAERE|nr:hypothetical protein GCK72_002780 [Caenorhabditis remanei]KAF1770956.1 hypothetical protein GCK72_002780 [Caenorhabditis remanei]